MKALFIKESLEKIQKFNRNDSVFGKLKIGSNPFNFYSSKYYIKFIEPGDWDDIILDVASELLKVDKNKIKVLSESDESSKREDLFYLPQSLAFEIYENDKNNIIEERTIYRNNTITIDEKEDIKVYTFKKSSRNIVYVLLREEDKEEFDWGIIILGAPDIFESINFERSGTPIEKIGIGQKEVDRQIIENTLWDNWSIEDLTKDNYEIINLTKNYKGVNILILKDKDDLKLPYIAVPSIVFTPQVSYQYCKTPKEAEDDTKSKIDQILSNKIKESLDFTKIGNPIKKMDIGKSTIDRKIIEYTIWNGFTIDYFENNNYEIIDLIRNYRGYPILVLKNNSESSSKLPYIAFSPFNINSFYFKTPENAIEFIKEKLDKHLYLMGESINFERKGTSIEKMDIGQQEILRQKAAKIDWDWNDPDEKLLKVFEWKSYWIKITEIKRNRKIQYRGTSDCGEPYMDEPDLYDTPEEAEEKIKSWLYDY